MGGTGCPCDDGGGVSTTPFNVPGLTSIRYRVGDFASFRAALLRGREGEAALRGWSPGATGDLAVQLVEWWAYLGDVLTFYNERAAHDGFLRTGSSIDATIRLVRVLGYRPRPAIAARGAVAAVVRAKRPFTLPPGLAIQSRPSPGENAQVFEVDAAAEVRPGDGVAAFPRSRPLVAEASGGGHPRLKVYLSGAISGVQIGDRFLLARRSAEPSKPDLGASMVVSVDRVATTKDPEGTRLTELTLSLVHGAPDGVTAPSDHVLWRSHASMPFYAGAASEVITEVGGGGIVDAGPKRLASNGTDDTTNAMMVRRPVARGLAESVRADDSNESNHDHRFLPDGEARLHRLTVHLDGVIRGVRAGAAVLLDAGELVALAGVYTITTRIWYANAEAATPGTRPSGENIVPIPVPHSAVAFVGAAFDRAAFNERRVGALLRYDFRPLEVLVDPPVTEVALPSAAPLRLAASLGRPDGSAVFIEDATEHGVRGTLCDGGAAVSFAAGDAPTSLTAPLRAFANLVSVSRGKTVSREVLGNGDPSVAGQVFVLKQSPLTYLATEDPLAPGGYVSTLRIWVDGVAWTEVPSFYQQPPDARVFVTSEDSDQRTTVVFGDGVQGARLPAGVDNIVASYRHGAGSAAPPAGTLSAVLTPWPGLVGVRSPVAPGGGADRDPAGKIQQYAPRSVLTFDRAVSADDLTAIAVDAPGVARARAYFTWDGAEQRTLVKLYVGDDAAALASARRAIARASDPARPIRVLPVVRRQTSLSLTVLYDARRVGAEVQAAVADALVAEGRGLFCAARAVIGAAIHDSQIYDACLTVAGTVAVESVILGVDGLAATARHDPGEGGVFELTRERLTITMRAIDRDT